MNFRISIIVSDDVYLESIVPHLKKDDFRGVRLTGSSENSISTLEFRKVDLGPWNEEINYPQKLVDQLCDRQFNSVG